MGSWQSHDFPDPRLDSEAALVQSALAGQREAFDRLFEHHFERVFAAALRRLGDPARAEAVTTAVFEGLVEVLPQYRGDRPLASWILTLAAHEIGRQGPRGSKTDRSLTPTR